MSERAFSSFSRSVLVWEACRTRKSSSWARETRDMEARISTSRRPLFTVEESSAILFSYHIC